MNCGHVSKIFRASLVSGFSCSWNHGRGKVRWDQICLQPVGGSFSYFFPKQCGHFVGGVTSTFHLVWKNHIIFHHNQIWQFVSPIFWKVIGGLSELVDLSDRCSNILSPVTKDFRYLEWRNPHLYKLYGYGLCKGKPSPKIAFKKILFRKHCIFGTWNCLDLLVILRLYLWQQTGHVHVALSVPCGVGGVNGCCATMRLEVKKNDNKPLQNHWP